MTNIRFPETNMVQCVFSWRTSGSDHMSDNRWDEYDHHVSPSRLKKYLYRVPECLRGQLQVGDAVLVHCITGYQVCEVVEINALSNLDIKTLAPVVCKVDLCSYIDEIEKQKHLQAMKAEIDREKKRLESMVTYELIAEKNPEFKALLEEFKAQGGEF